MKFNPHNTAALLLEIKARHLNQTQARQDQETRSRIAKPWEE